MTHHRKTNPVYSEPNNDTRQIQETTRRPEERTPETDRGDQQKVAPGNGIYSRYLYPVNSEHTHSSGDTISSIPQTLILWSELESTQRLTQGPLNSMASIFLSSALEDRQEILLCRCGVSQRHRPFPLLGLPDSSPGDLGPDINVYDMRLVQHEDGWIMDFLHRTQGS